MSIQLVIDNREKKLIELLQLNTNVTVEMLDLGDILFKKGDEIVLIIERKTVNDLKASICDGRGREQKARLIGGDIAKERVLYLIEGNLDKSLDDKISGLPVSTLLGSLINTQLRDGIKVYKTASLNETAEFIRKLLEKLEKDSDKYFNDEHTKVSACEYSSTLKKKKKANMTGEVWFIAQLSLIPQVTEVVANEIVKKYPTVSHLIHEYDRTPEHLQEKLLSDITFPLKTGKSRRVGDKISTRIFQFLHGINQEISED